MFSLGVLYSVREMQKALFFFFFFTKGVQDKREKLQIQQIQLLLLESNLSFSLSSHLNFFL